MKKLLLTLACVVALATACSTEAPLGKSLSRWNDFTVESASQDCAKGLKYIEVTMNTIIGKDTAGVRERAAAYKAKIDSAGIKIWSVHLPYSKHIDISLVDSAKRAKAVNYVRDMMKVAAIFQPQNFVLHPSADTVVPDDRADRIENCRASIGELAPVAAEIGATLCIECSIPRRPDSEDAACLPCQSPSLRRKARECLLLSAPASRGSKPAQARPGSFSACPACWRSRSQGSRFPGTSYAWSRHLPWAYDGCPQ